MSYLIFPSAPDELPSDLQVNTNKVDYNKLGGYQAQFTSESGAVNEPKQFGPGMNIFNYHVGTFTAQPITIKKGGDVPTDAKAYHPDYYDGTTHYLTEGIGVKVDTSKVNNNTPGTYPVKLSYHPTSGDPRDTITTTTNVTVLDGNAIAPTQLYKETIHYVGENGKSILPDEEIKGLENAPFSVEAKQIPGYQFLPDKSSKLTGRFGNDGSIVLVYQKVDNGAGNEVPNKPHGNGNDNGEDGVRKHSKVYALHAINMYKHDNLTGKIRHYKKVKRINRPRFLVKRVAWNHGHARYYVKELNKNRYGWITGNMKFVQNNYYQPRKRSVKFRVIRPSGLREYRRKNLSGSRGGMLW